MQMTPTIQYVQCAAGEDLTTLPDDLNELSLHHIAYVLQKFQLVFFLDDATILHVNLSGLMRLTSDCNGNVKDELEKLLEECWVYVRRSREYTNVEWLTIEFDTADEIPKVVHSVGVFVLRALRGYDSDVHIFKYRLSWIELMKLATVTFSSANPLFDAVMTCTESCDCYPHPRSIVAVIRTMGDPFNDAVLYLRYLLEGTRRLRRSDMRPITCATAVATVNKCLFR